MNIADIDQNFRLKTTLPDEPITWYESFDGPLRIHGLSWAGNRPPFCRMDPACLDQMNEGVRVLAYHTAGIRLRLKTDSAFLAVKAKLSSPDDMSHMPRSGSSGFDLYSGSAGHIAYRRTFMPEAGSDLVVGEHIFAEPVLQDLTLNFPLYNGVLYLAIGLQAGVHLESAGSYRQEKPVVFYGSSITQGGCASRPGNSYQLMLSRLLDMDIVNLGFSGSARGEREMAEYITKLDMSAFVMDYDHNAPSPEYLQETHARFFQVIRSARPDLPIILMTKPDYNRTVRTDALRRSIVFATYRQALDAGDEHVFFVDGERLFGSFLRDSCTVDGCHPNDLGFMRMAEALYPTLAALMP